MRLAHSSLFGLILTVPILCLSLTSASAADCDGRLIEDEMLVASPLCLPETAERIVVLDPFFSLGMALELELPVVAAPLTGMSDLDLKARAEAAGVADIGSVLEPSIESVVAAQPDLIIGSAVAESYYPMLSQIAPTALIGVGETDWREYERMIARISDREDEFEQQLAKLDKRIDQLRPKIPDTKVSIIRITPWDFQVYLDSSSAYGPFALLRELGVKRTEYETDSAGLDMKRPDWEKLEGLDGDILLYIIGGMNNSAETGRLDEVRGNPLWQMLPAVQSGKVYPINPGIWMEFSGIASAHRVLDDVERLVIGE